MVSGLIPDSQISVWPQSERGWLAENARLLTGRSGWTPAQMPPGPLRSLWLQVDLGEERLVTGVLLQGAKQRERRLFTKKFRLAYANDGLNWTNMLDHGGAKPRVRPSASPSVCARVCVCVCVCVCVIGASQPLSA